MSRFHAHINTAKTIIDLYKGEGPFSLFLKNFFSKEKKYGSRDRKTISSLCYNYFRIGHALETNDLTERLLAGRFLCREEPDEIFQNERPGWNENISLPLEEKVAFLNIPVQNIFPFAGELSEEIDAKLFNTSFLIQPKLFVRIRNGKQDQVKSKLVAARIPFEEISETCLAFANGTKLDDVININSEAVIQDLNSQRTAELMMATTIKSPANIWDCCAASGGKSIMACDLFPGCQLTVSDVRLSIIHNLKKRFKEAAISRYTSFAADITQRNNLQGFLKNSLFDLVICDAPCSGSGTWSRTPEQLLFFKKGEIEKYACLQKKIASATVAFVRKGGFFLYITCSAFQKENEEVVNFIQQNSQLTLVKSELLKGYEIQADTMFAALFQA